jgi:hypothetical protein
VDFTNAGLSVGMYLFKALFVYILYSGTIWEILFLYFYYSLSLSNAFHSLDPGSLLSERERAQVGTTLIIYKGERI